MTWTLFIIPLTLIVVQLLKAAMTSTKWLPHLAVLIGAMLGLAFAVYYGADWLEHIVGGAIYGAAAAGIYDVGESTTNMLYLP